MVAILPPTLVSGIIEPLQTDEASLMIPHAINLPDLSFKGNRTYIHGTEFFDVISSFLQSQLPAHHDGFITNLSFRQFAIRQCQIFLYSPPESKAECICHGLWCSGNANEPIRFWVYEREDPVTERYEFDEKLICSGSELFDDRVRSFVVPEFSLIENIVALTKHLHNVKWPLEEGKWVFGQIVLKRALPSQSKTIEIWNFQNIKNRFSRNKIFVDQREVGDIRFIVS